jgi:Methyltransferase domain
MAFTFQLHAAQNGEKKFTHETDMSMNTNSAMTEYCNCPYCKKDSYSPWAVENGFTTVRCNQCQFLYLNPRPNSVTRDKATEMGVHGAADSMDISERYAPKKVRQYQKILKELFPEFATSKQPVTWMDIGAGYGEFVEAVKSVTPEGSIVRGLEPMRVKAAAAQKRGHDIIPTFINADTPKSQYVSLLNVFSHVNDFDEFLGQISGIVLPGGELFIETGDMSNIDNRDEFPGILGSPDHVAFAGQKHLEGFLKRHGFEVIKIDLKSIDGYAFTIKNIVKKLIGRNVRLKLPNSSAYRTMRVRARKC